MPGVVSDQESQARCSSGRTRRERDRLLDPSAQGVWRGSRARPAPVSGRRPRVPVRALAPASRRRQVRCCPASAGPGASPPASSSQRAPVPARRACGRHGDCRWELDPSAADLREFIVKLHQQYETPPAVMDFVRCTWRPTFDAMATPWGMASGYGTVRNKLVWVRSRIESVIDYLPSSRPRQ